MSIVLEIFCLTVAVTMPSSTEFSVLIRFVCSRKPSSWSVMRRGTDVFPLYNIPLTYASAADATTCFRILHYVWIGPFSGGGRFGGFARLFGSELS